MNTPNKTAGASDTAQHTPGPFTFRADLAKAFVGFWTVPVFSGKARVAIGRGPTLEIAIANARLIAAAPALLAALELALVVITRDVRQGSCPSGVENRIRDALDKAKPTP